ncbi:hypothetical protein NUW58_g8053 [Xylaria curta]|uniref:Uncharacterized protein n=1 Tax=Xylaria curta TaxID=42375 RepID=A0ACC1NBA9_9PEZI|nr:hypothetical protein NUW58_g8053 [Xylaria curta]
MDAVIDALKAYLPPGEGYLPYYMFGLSVIAVGNSLQNYLTLHYSRRLYNGQFVPRLVWYVNMWETRIRCVKEAGYLFVKIIDSEL